MKKTKPFRVGDLVTYSAERQELGVFLGETQLSDSSGRLNAHNTYWSTVLGWETSTLPFLDLLRRVPLPEDPRSTPARGDPR